MASTKKPAKRIAPKKRKKRASVKRTPNKKNASVKRTPNKKNAPKKPVSAPRAAPPKKPVARPTAKQRRIQNELDTLAPLITKAQTRLKRAQDDEMALHAEIQETDKRRKAAAKARETKYENEQKRLDAEQEEFQKKLEARHKRNKKAKRTSRKKIGIYFTHTKAVEYDLDRGKAFEDKTPGYAHIEVKELPLQEILNLVIELKDSGVSTFRFVVEIPASPAYPGRMNTKMLSLHNKDRAQIRKLLGGMMTPGREYINKIVLNRSDFNKLDEEARAHLEKEELDQVGDETAARKLRRKERQRAKERAEARWLDTEKRYMRIQQEHYKALDRILRRQKDARRALNALLAERREWRRQLK